MSRRGSPQGLPAFAPSGFFVLRTPLLALEELLAFSDRLRAPVVPRGSPARLAAALDADRTALERRLRALAKRPEVREAIYLASPSLDESLEVWLRDPGAARGPKVVRALFRYFARMAARPTPFGLFAGVSWGRVGERTHLTLEARSASRKHARLDLSFLAALADAVARHPGLRPQLRFRPGLLLHDAGDSFRGVARVGPEGTRQSVSAPASRQLEIALARAGAEGGASLSEIASALVAAEPSPGADEALALATEWAERQIFIPDLSPPVTGPDPLEPLLRRLRPLDAAHQAVEQLEAASRELARLSAEGLGSKPWSWRALANALAGLPSRIELEGTFAGASASPAEPSASGYEQVLGRIARADAGLYRLLSRGLEARAARAQLPHVAQVELFKSSPSATLGRAVTDELLRGAELLRRITPAEDPLAAFTAAFTERYGDEEVPLLVALDEEHGLPFPAEAPHALREPLLQGLPLPEAQAAPPFGAREALLLERLHEALRANARSLELSPEELDQLAVARPQPLPDAFAALGALAAESEEALAAGRFRLYLARVVGPSGVTLLGRFCHGDAGLAAQVAAHLRAEEALRPDALFAEVAYLPDRRDGNVVRRPLLRQHEILLGAASGAPPDARIEPTDLRLAVVSGRLLLTSRTLGREILPRLTSAHHAADPRHLAVYRFLCALQHRDVAGSLAFSWGALEAAPFLPRVTSGRLVLSRARWRIGRARWTALGRTNGATRFAAVQAFRRDIGLPRFVELTERDNDLLLDLDNPLAVDELVELCRSRDAAVLTEPFPAPGELIARGPEGRYTHELIVPFVACPGPNARAARPPPRPVPAPRPNPPGSPWLFCKLYTTPAAADDLLRDIVRPVVERAIASGAASRWFFIRYTDPGFHLRVRFHGDPDALLRRVYADLQATAERAFAVGRIHRVQLDTYQRELDRYGGPDGIALAERMFHADSEAVLNLLEAQAGFADGRPRAWIAMRGMDQLLDDFGLSPKEKHALAAELRDDLSRRLGAGAALRHALAERFRAERSTLEAVLERSAAPPPALAPALPWLARRSEALRPIVEELQALERAGRLTRTLSELARSHVHMFANRLFRLQANEQELVCYDALARQYRSRLARADAR